MGYGKLASIAATLLVAGVAMPVAAAVDAAEAAPIGPAAMHARQEPAAQEVLVRLVGDFVRAQQSFDVPRLTALTTPDYLEISPVGEVDSREKMLDFYAPDKKSNAPAVEIVEPVVRVFGGTAIVIARLAYTVQVPGQSPRVMALRASFVARREGGGWKLVSAQYTGIRPVAK